MAHEFCYTSAPRGLEPGSKGFCPVAMTPGLSPALVRMLESLTAYKAAWRPSDPFASLNPVSYLHYIVRVERKSYHIVGRTGAAKPDESGRSNKFSHFLVLEPHELPDCGPVGILMQPGLIRTAWEGEPAYLPEPQIDGVDPLVEGTPTWDRLTGGTGWAEAFAESVQTRPVDGQWLIYPPGCDLLPILAEASGRLTPAQRWAATFNTSCSSLPPNVTCLWRGGMEGTAEADSAADLPGGRTIRLDGTMGDAADMPTVLEEPVPNRGLPEPTPVMPGIPGRWLLAVPVVLFLLLLGGWLIYEGMRGKDTDFVELSIPEAQPTRPTRAMPTGSNFRPEHLFDPLPAPAPVAVAPKGEIVAGIPKAAAIPARIEPPEPGAKAKGDFVAKVVSLEGKPGHREELSSLFGRLPGAGGPFTIQPKLWFSPADAPLVTQETPTRIGYFPAKQQDRDRTYASWQIEDSFLSFQKTPEPGIEPTKDSRSESVRNVLLEIRSADRESAFIAFGTRPPAPSVRLSFDPSAKTVKPVSASEKIALPAILRATDPVEFDVKSRIAFPVDNAEIVVEPSPESTADRLIFREARLGKIEVTLKRIAGDNPRSPVIAFEVKVLETVGPMPIPKEGVMQNGIRIFPLPPQPVLNSVDVPMPLEEPDAPRKPAKQQLVQANSISLDFRGTVYGVVVDPVERARRILIPVVETRKR